MYLSRLLLNPRSRAVRRDMGDCQRLHTTVMAAFPAVGGAARAQLGVLYRLEESRVSGRVSLLVQSEVPPDWSRLLPGYLLPVPSNPAIKHVSALLRAVEPGMLLRFRLLANVTKKVKSGPDGVKRNGRRVMLGTEAEQLAWLQRRAEAGGFRLTEVMAAPGVPDVLTLAAGHGRIHGRHAAGDLSFGGVLFEGRLRVTDPDRFRATLRMGVGAAKAYGFGMLSVAPGGVR